MSLDFTKLINHKAVVPGLLGVSVFSAGLAAGVILERVLGAPKPGVHILAEPQDPTRLFNVEDAPNSDRVVITLEEAIAMRKDEVLDELGQTLWSDVEPAFDGDGEKIKWSDETEVAEDFEPPAHIPEVMLEKTASEVSPVPFNVLDAGEDPVEVAEWDWDKEVQIREANPEGPYQIHEDEYASGSANFHIQELRYYGVDQIVCEELDPRAMMYDHAIKLGDVRFGYGAHDEDVAFVRNPKHRTDYQITQMHDSYSESVMGIIVEDEAEQEHLAHMDRPLRMRRSE